MNRILLLSILIYSLIFVGLASRKGGFILLSLPFLLYLAAGLLFSQRELKLQASRTISPDRISQTMLITVELVITNQGPRLEEIFLEDQLPLGLEVIDGQTNLLLELEQGATATMHYRARGKRGNYPFQELRATAYDRLGLFKTVNTFACPSQLFILPEVLKLKRVAIRPRQTRVYSGSFPAQQGGTGIEFFGVREFQPGDSLSWINWRMSARHPEELYSNEFQQERVADVGLILDARENANITIPGDSLFEHQVTAAASLSQALLNDGNRIGLLVYGGFQGWIYPGYGKVQCERILQSLARARTGNSMIFDHLEYLPTRMFPFRSQIILISSLLNEDLPFLIQLRARGFQLMILSPDPIAFQLKSLPVTQATRQAIRLARMERDLMFTRLRHTGVQVLSWDTATPFNQAMSLPLNFFSAWSHLMEVRL